MMTSYWGYQGNSASKQITEAWGNMRQYMSILNMTWNTSYSGPQDALVGEETTEQVQVQRM